MEPTAYVALLRSALLVLSLRTLLWPRMGLAVSIVIVLLRTVFSVIRVVLVAIGAMRDISSRLILAVSLPPAL